MKMCCISDCQKKEWARRRRLRLEQVRKQSSEMAKEIRERVLKERNYMQTLLDEKRAFEIEQWKEEQIHILEADYLEAIGKVGLAREEALKEPDPSMVMESQRQKNQVRTLARGRSAERRAIEEARAKKEKQERPIQRRRMIREVEDIRAGLVVQAGELTKRLQPQIVVEKIAVTDGSEKSLKRPFMAVPKSLMEKESPEKQDDASPSKLHKIVSPKRNKEKTQLKANKIEEAPSTASNIEKKDSDGQKIDDSREKLTELNELNWSNDETARELARAIRQKQRHQLIEQLGHVVQEIHQRETRKPTASRRPEKKIANKTVMATRKRIDRLDQGTSTMVRERDVLSMIDKALEEGRQMRQRFASTQSPRSVVAKSSSESNTDDDEDEHIIKVVVNVHCGKFPESDNKLEKLTADVGTEIGESFAETTTLTQPAEQETVIGATVAATENDIEDSSGSCRVRNFITSTSSTSYFSPPSKIYSSQEEEEHFKLNPVLDYYIRRLLKLAPRCVCSNSSTSSSSLASVCENCSKVCLQFDDSSYSSATAAAAAAAADGDDDSSKLTTIAEDKYKDESEACSRKISEIEKELEQVRKEKAQLQTSPESDLQKDNEQQNNTGPELSNIMADLIARNLIEQPFRWSSGESLSSPTNVENQQSSEELEGMLTRLRMDWAKSCIRKSHDSMAALSNSDEYRDLPSD